MTEENKKHADKADKKEEKMEEKKIVETKANTADAEKDKMADAGNGKDNKHEHSHEGHEHSHENSKEQKKEDKKEKKEIKHPKKEEAIATALNTHLSKKHCMYICNFIKGKKIDDAMEKLSEVIKFKRVIPFKGEIPHRSQLGVMSGRYPIKASKYFITLLKGLKGNAIQNGLDLDKTIIYFGSANWASRPGKSGGRRAKRAHITLKAREVRSPQRESPQSHEELRSKSESDLKEKVKSEKKVGEKK